MNLQQLRYVRALVEEGSFIAAAARCAVTQPTLSNGIAQLEAEIGHRIFNRTTRSLSLTATGERLLPLVLETLDCYDRLKDMTRKIGDNNAVVHTGISPVVGVRMAEERLEKFHASRPDVDVVYREGNLSELCEQLRREQLDIIISPLDERSAPQGEYAFQCLYSEPLLFLPRGEDSNRWRDVHRVNLREIAKEEFVLVPNVCGLTQVTKRIFDDEDLRLNRYPGEASSYSVVQEWTELGLGCGILPASKIEEAARKRAIPIFNDGHPVEIKYFAIGKPNTIPPQLFAELWEALKPEIPCTAIDATAQLYDWTV
ncbi:MAG: LysR family transcriptional regulator [Methyloligella sp. ZOD6]